MTIKLNSQQEAAIREFRDWWKNRRLFQPIFYLAGYGGTGKSTILPLLLEETGLDLETTTYPAVAPMAPTAKAALVMTKNFHRAGYTGTFARTIHHYLYVPFEDDFEDELAELEAETDPTIKARREFELARKLAKRKIGFSAGTGKRLAEAELIVVDEGSMVGSKIASDLINTGLPILVMGDPGQLPPVNDTAGLTSGKPDVFLTDIRRQAKDNPIILFASLLREGQTVPPGEYDGKLFVYTAREAEDRVEITDGRQIILGTHKRRWSLTRGLRKLIHNVDPDTPPLEGEPIIVKRNHKKYPHIVNGSLGTVSETIQEWNLPTASATMDAKIEGVPFYGEVYSGLFQEHIYGVAGYCASGPRATLEAQRRAVHADWAYCITCHAAQGSQFEHPIVFDESSVFREDRLKWAYTAASRAQEKLTWIGN